MKKLRLLLLSGLLIPLVGLSQNTVEDVRPQDLIQEFGLEVISPNFSVNPSQIAPTPNPSNTIYIEQIGINNNIQVKTEVERSALDLVQDGSNNVMKINYMALTSRESILQQGNNHYLASFGKTPTLNLDRTIQQNGYGQHLTIHGNNSISEKIKLNMQGASSTVVIRNFN